MQHLISMDLFTMLQWQSQLAELRKDPRVPIVITAFLAILLLLAMWQLISNLRVAQTIIPATQTEITSQPLQNITPLHLFGVHTNALDALPVTTLQLTLEGTVVVVNEPTKSRALISTRSVPTKVYQVGDTVPGNATITHIEKDDVILDENGTLEKLTLPVKTLFNVMN